MGSAALFKAQETGRLVLRQQAVKAQHDDFLTDVTHGLEDNPKHIPPKYFYDAQGSELFERITDTPEYYVTRTEEALLEAHGDTIVEDAGLPETVVELGSGSARKTRALL